MLKPDSIIGTYRVIRLLGEGGMGAVYEVEHIQLGVRYALKAFTPNDDHNNIFFRRFAAEGRMLARLKHPNLTSVFDLQQDPPSGLLYYVMDLVLFKDGESRTLSDLEPGGADEERIVDWFGEMCNALAYVHTQGIVHRDIKLNNILITQDYHLVLSDFGISRVFKDDLREQLNVSRTMTSATSGKFIVGTQGYMAPEMLRGETATPATDVYALGVVFFKLLTGVWYDPDLEPSPDGEPTAGMTDAVRLLADFEHPWKNVLPQMLASDPSQRPTDLAALPALLTLPDSAGAAESFPRRHFRWPALFAIGIAALLALAAGIFWLVSSQPVEEPTDDDHLLDDALAVPESIR